MSPDTEYIPRLTDPHLSALLTRFPAILINGPRATGKTTTARRYCASEVRLDQPAQAAAFKADPDAALRNRAEPVLLDEWQEVPDLLGAVKRSVDNDPRPGRFILTGSVRSDIEQQMWPGTGRLIRVHMYGMTTRELRGPDDHQPISLLDKIMSGLGELKLPTPRPDLRDYVDLALRGGFPALAVEPHELDTVWIDSYVEQLLTRDAHLGLGHRDPHKLARYFEAIAANSAGIPEHKTLYDAAGISRPTADTYDDLLARLYVADAVPAWSNNRVDRLTKTPKRYIVDGALMASALEATTETILADSDLLGRTIDTFVMTQLRPEIALDPRRIRLHHLRTKAGREEIDIVVELPGHKLVAIEIKASAAPSRDDSKHLRWLRDKFPDRFVNGIVFHTGPDVIQLDDRILAVPICAFWG